MDLVRVVNEEWPEKLDALKKSQATFRETRRAAGESPESSPKAFLEVESAVNASYTEAEDLANRMYTLLRHCSLIDPMAPYWSLAFDKLRQLIGTLRTLSPNRDGSVLDEKCQWGLRNKVFLAHDDLSAHLELLIMTNKPPKSHRIRRHLGRARWRLSRSRGRKERADTEAALNAWLSKAISPND